MIDYLNMVKEFHIIFTNEIGPRPQNINRKSFARRTRLIAEEFSEYCQAVSTDNIIEIADSLGDLLYVVFGAAIEHGLPMDRIFKKIHESNMTKKDGHKDSSGKWIKPDNYKPVDLSWLLETKEAIEEEDDEKETCDNCKGTCSPELCFFYERKD